MKVQFEYGYVQREWPRGGYIFADSHIVIDSGNADDRGLFLAYMERGIKPVKQYLAIKHNIDPSCITIKAIGEDGVWREVYQ